MQQADSLIIKADLSLLYSILGEFVEISKLFEDSKEMIKLLQKLDRFVSIHETRCNDLMLLKEKVDTARSEYQSLTYKYKGTKEALELLKEAHNQLLESKL
mgnify:CR=1 FL=1|jgi:hypothetical protein